MVEMAAGPTGTRHLQKDGFNQNQVRARNAKGPGPGMELNRRPAGQYADSTQRPDSQPSLPFRVRGFQPLRASQFLERLRMSAIIVGLAPEESKQESESKDERRNGGTRTKASEKVRRRGSNNSASRLEIQC